MGIGIVRQPSRDIRAAILVLSGSHIINGDGRSSCVRTVFHASVSNTQIMALNENKNTAIFIVRLLLLIICNKLIVNFKIKIRVHQNKTYLLI